MCSSSGNASLSLPTNIDCSLAPGRLRNLSVAFVGDSLMGELHTLLAACCQWTVRSPSRSISCPSFPCTDASLSARGQNVVSSTSASGITTTRLHPCLEGRQREPRACLDGSVRCTWAPRRRPAWQGLPHGRMYARSRHRQAAHRVCIPPAILRWSLGRRRVRIRSNAIRLHAAGGCGRAALACDALDMARQHPAALRNAERLFPDEPWCHVALSGRMRADQKYLKPLAMRGIG